MTVNELYQKLGEFIKEGYGEVDVVDDYDDDIMFVELRKFFKEYNDGMIVRATVDLDSNIFEEIYESDEDSKKYFVSKGKCIKIY